MSCGVVWCDLMRCGACLRAFMDVCMHACTYAWASVHLWMYVCEVHMYVCDLFMQVTYVYTRHQTTSHHTTACHIQSSTRAHAYTCARMQAYIHTVTGANKQHTQTTTCTYFTCTHVSHYVRHVQPYIT